MKNKRSLFLYMLVNPIFIIVYGIAWRELFLLCQYGYLQRNVPVLFCCALFFLIWLIWFIVRCIRKKEIEIKEKYRRFYKPWICIALIIIMSITSIFGYRVYQSGRKGQGYLASKLSDLKNNKKITYKNENKIYKDGLKGIIDNISKKVDLPEDMYIGSLDIIFKKDGTITYFSGSLYDKYVPNKEDTITPRRYNLVENIRCIEAEDYVGTTVESEEDTEDTLQVGETEIEEDGTIVYKFNENIEYRLEVTDASLGSRSYALYKKDSEKENLWTKINSCPFGITMGQAASITFINEDLGFLVLSYSGGSSGRLFRTEDGGKSYEEIEVKSATGEFMGSDFEPFDFPERIYEKDGFLYMKVGQGNDGDYNGNSMGLYKSKDKGKTWEFEKEVSGEYN